MKVFHENDLKKGWFVGDFDPTCFKSPEVEVAVKRYSAGDYEPSHHHKVAKELTFIVEGEVEMNGVRYNKGCIILMEPGESTDFEAISDAVNVVVKLPCVKNDKYED